MQNVSDRHHEVLYQLRLSERYHHRRVRFFDLCDTWIKALSVIGGASAVAILRGGENPSTTAISIMFAISLLNTLGLVFGITNKARVHTDLARKYFDIEAALVKNVSPSLEYLAETVSKIRVIESQEPPSLGALVTICQNELARQDGCEEDVVPVPPYKRLLAHFFDFEAPKPKKVARH